MFDHIRCEIELPDGVIAGESEFQTKSLYNALDRFTITKEGRLVHHSATYVWEDAPAEAPPSDSILARMPRRKLVDQREIDMEFHGHIRFYGDVEGTRRDYAARFTHGSVEWIKRVEDLSDREKNHLDLGWF